MGSLPGTLAGLNKAAVAAAKAGQHQEALDLYDRLFARLSGQHLSHPELFITHSNRAASHLALGQHTQALQDAKRCLELLTSSAAASGLSTPSRHPHWPKACLRLGQAFQGLGQHKQAAAAFEAGLATDPLNPGLKSGLQQAQQGLTYDLMSGKTLMHLKALPAPAIPERITQVPYNTPSRASAGTGLSSSSSSSPNGLVSSGRGYKVGWQSAGDQAAALAAAAEAVTVAAAAVDHEQAEAAGGLQSTVLPTEPAASVAMSSSQLPHQLLPPEAATADVGLRDVYEYLATQCAIRQPKHYLYRVLPDAARMSAWGAATTAAVQAVQSMGRLPRVLLLGAKAGVLAVAAVRAGAAHVTCVESCPYLSAACHRVLQANGVPKSAFSIISTSSPATLTLGSRQGLDVPNICNCLIADLIDDGVLSAGFIPAVSNALKEVLVRDDPVLVPHLVTVMAQAVGVRPSVVEVGDRCCSAASDACNVPAAAGQQAAAERKLAAAECSSLGLPSKAAAVSGGGWASIELADVSEAQAHAADAAGSACDASDAGKVGNAGLVLDLSALDRFRWTPSQALPSPLDPSTFIPLSAPQRVWHLPSIDATADRSGVQHMDIELTQQGSWCAMAFWAELELFGDIMLSTAGPWQPTALPGSSHSTPHHHSFQAVRSSNTTPANNGTFSIQSTCSHSSGINSISGKGQFKAPPSYQPAICWLPGALPVSAGHIYPIVASHNTVRLMFSIKEADYSFLFTQDPSFPQGHFAMMADQHRLSAYYTALKTAIARSASAKQQVQQEEEALAGRDGCAQPFTVEAAAAAAAKDAVAGSTLASPMQCVKIEELNRTVSFRDTDVQQQNQQQRLQLQGQVEQESVNSTPAINVSVLDVGCASGVLSLLAAAAAAVAGGAPSATSGPADPADGKLQHQKGGRQPQLQLQQPVKASVVGVEMVAPLANAAQRAVAANGAADCVSIMHADAASLQRGVQLPLTGADVIVLDVFNAGLIGHGVLGLLELVKARLGADGAQVLPASATLYCMGIEVVTVNSWKVDTRHHLSTHHHHHHQQQQQMKGGATAAEGGAQQQERMAACCGLVNDQGSAAAGDDGCSSAAAEGMAPLGLSVLDQFRWSNEPDTVYLHHLPHKQVTATAKLADFDFCAPVGTPYPKEMEVQLEVLETGKLNGLVMWFDLHLAEGVSLTSAPIGFTTGGRRCDVTLASHLPPDEVIPMSTSTAAPDQSEGQHPQQQMLPQDLQQQQQHQHHWGQSLYYLDCVAHVQPGDEIHFAAARDGPRLKFNLLTAHRTKPSATGFNLSTAPAEAPFPSSTDGRTANGNSSPLTNTQDLTPQPDITTAQQERQHLHNHLHQQQQVRHQERLEEKQREVVVQAAPRPPWLRPGAGIEDPAVWSVKKCEQLLGQMLMRAPGGKFPPIWKDLELMQVHAGSLGLCAATVGAVSQELTMREALAVASQKQLLVSPVAVAEAAQTQPPVVWR